MTEICTICSYQKNRPHKWQCEYQHVVYLFMYKYNVCIIGSTFTGITVSQNISHTHTYMYVSWVFGVSHRKCDFAHGSKQTPRRKWMPQYLRLPFLCEPWALEKHELDSKQLVVHLRSMLFVGSSQPGSVQPQVNLTFHDDHSWLAIQSDLGWDHPSDSLKSKDRLPHEHRQELGIYTIVERGVLIWCNYLYLVSQPETIRENNLEPRNHSPPGDM